MINVLKNTCFFKGIEEKEINDILKSELYLIKEYKKNEVIANQGEKCNSLSVILEGKAVIQTIYENGKVLTLANFNVSDVFAEALLFSKDKEYPATVMAVENCKVLSFPKNSVLGIMQKNTKFAENLLQLLSQKIVILNRKINLIELDSIRRKVCKILLDNYKKNNTYSYKISSKKELAEELGIPRPSLSRELINMKDLGLIDFNLKEIIITDLEGLEDEFFIE
ncbi:MULTISPECIES: Crp/Fnr family transcriptional regulator [unclassified Clostridium]|jgi:transcriptional regulatory protein|uniref:Crp/Fnr family transcriptional regulator n=1 Tax=unclassified Clostridium TaxID=2614128 RepID=UPI0025C2EB24|nr:Crp/Fnr family transcriptional regulator [Clostridium sp.]MDY4252953.1 Crp/Fnr family transcriptional regulator [Clostridium sp.]MDY6226651.1 Crp/Fnr family transcriptional regulator [Clostridium sp.]